jgi:hypothetical protein
MLHQLADRAAAYCEDRTAKGFLAWTNIDGSREPLVALAHGPLVSAWATGYLLARVVGALAAARA